MITELECSMLISISILPLSFRYEWSIGFSISVVHPVGVFDPAVDRVWFDSELDTHAVHMLERGTVFLNLSFLLLRIKHL